MGVKTVIELDELNKLFPSYEFCEIIPTISGIVDTTYIVHTKKKSYILKKYERDIASKIALDIKLLEMLKSSGLNVPTCRDAKDGWYIYERLNGSQPKEIKNFHIQAVARFLAKLHKHTSKIKCSVDSTIADEVMQSLSYVKKNYFSYYKRFEFLKHHDEHSDGIVHGDIFKDNTIFDGRMVGVIDFIDSTCATFEYDVAVTLVGFDVKADNEYYINLFLKSYNQNALKKLDKPSIKTNMRFASHFFALKRVYRYKNIKRAKELL